MCRLLKTIRRDRLRTIRFILVVGTIAVGSKGTVSAAADVRYDGDTAMAFVGAQHWNESGWYADKGFQKHYDGYFCLCECHPSDEGIFCKGAGVHPDGRTKVAEFLGVFSEEMLEVGVSLVFVAVRIAYVRFVDEEDDDDDDNNNGVKTETVGHATLRTSINLLERVLVLLVYYFLYRATIGFADCVANVIAVDRSKSRSKVDDLLGPLVSEACKFVIGLLYVIMSLQQLGLNVWTAVVGVGVLSLVCSFAAQEYVKSLFGLVTLVVERPLDVGDFVTINGVTGTVLDVSLRYCHVEGADACMYAVPNSYFLAGIVKNFSKRKRIYAKIEFDLLNDEEKRGDDEGGGRTGVKISVDGGVADEGIFRSADRFSIFRTGLLRAMNAKPEFVGGIAPSVRMGFHEGSVRCVINVNVGLVTNAECLHFLRRRKTIRARRYDARTDGSSSAFLVGGQRRSVKKSKGQQRSLWIEKTIIKYLNQTAASEQSMKDVGTTIAKLKRLDQEKLRANGKRIGEVKCLTELEKLQLVNSRFNNSDMFALAVEEIKTRYTDMEIKGVFDILESNLKRFEFEATKDWETFVSRDEDDAEEEDGEGGDNMEMSEAKDDDREDDSKPTLVKMEDYSSTPSLVPTSGDDDRGSGVALKRERG
eukprot:g755.t1